jgi:hypothetical protein
MVLTPEQAQAIVGAGAMSDEEGETAEAPPETSDDAAEPVTSESASEPVTADLESTDDVPESLSKQADIDAHQNGTEESVAVKDESSPAESEAAEPEDASSEEQEEPAQLS